MFDEKNSSLEDLIGSTQQPIIVEKQSNDKKFLYTLLILLVVLFLVALGLIAFLGGKYFGGNSNTTQQQAVVQEQPIKKSEKLAAVEVAREVTQKAVAKQDNVKKEDSSVSELEQLVQEKEQPKAKTAVEKSITQVAKSSGKGLSKEELATIAKLVAQELSKSNIKPTKENVKASGTTSQSDAALVESLQNAQTDTLQDQKIDTSSVKKSDVKATSNKKVDTFNKVVVKKNSGEDDELAKLSSEIDTILQSEDVKKEEKNLKYKSTFDKEANVRAGELRFIVVKKGDTLSSIAYRAYGNWSAYTKIYRANPDLVKNPNKIYVGMKLRVPVDSEFKTSGR